MGKKNAQYTEGQYVFAKVKGFSPWPAKITRIMAKHRYSVYFYGTGEVASVKTEDLVPYNEATCKKHNTERQLKKLDYKLAVDQIEEALKGNDPAPAHVEVKNLNESEFSTNNITETDHSADESQLQIVEETPKPTPIKKKPVPPPPLPVVETVTAIPEPEVKEKENDEKVSRSGRKIKEKKMNLDEMDPDEMFTQPRKRIKTDDTRPAHKNANNSSLEYSTTAIEEFRASKMHILLDPVKKGLLENQYEMIHIVQDIKLALGLQQADVDKALELLETFKSKILPNITDLMLLKYPNTVDTIKRLRKYIGNLSSWKFENAQEVQFQEKANHIRMTATFVYDEFKKLFDFADAPTFWSKFAEVQKDFNAKYNVLVPADLFEGLSMEELDSFVLNRTHRSAEDENEALPISGDSIDEGDEHVTNEDEIEPDNTNHEPSQMEVEPTH